MIAISTKCSNLSTTIRVRTNPQAFSRYGHKGKKTTDRMCLAPQFQLVPTTMLAVPLSRFKNPFYRLTRFKIQILTK